MRALIVDRRFQTYYFPAFWSLIILVFLFSEVPVQDVKPTSPILSTSVLPLLYINAAKFRYIIHVDHEAFLIKM